MTLTLGLLVTALLFGGMTLFAFGFAAALFKTLPVAEARKVIRASFPHFYLFVIGASALGALLLLWHDLSGALLLAAIAGTTVWARQGLMPAINAATDRGETGRFRRLHGLSVGVTLLHIVAAGYTLVRLI
ncbi:DUF4149 domain-containing protein [Sulfitobacter sabulilitoris]|uniref:DUF4149 domain-containing protein n=1 Tax=Sulfitobacter sabulilitoris TaxID=2562655 RepID=A0A5S3PHN4_9RHOB|nr:DUF4149 domain-containing protein [Sulfitobacter sabulilitoris]TMM51284.1 DUF4149 domain-containing protein [Sulfitobacter sabulilitoris]